MDLFTGPGGLVLENVSGGRLMKKVKEFFDSAEYVLIRLATLLFLIIAIYQLIKIHI